MDRFCFTSARPGHGGRNNRSTTPRLGAFASYSLRHLRQEENQFLIAPPDVARTAADGVAGLIGYRVGTPYLGYVLEPEIAELFVDLRAFYLAELQVTREIEQRIHENKETAQ